MFAGSGTSHAKTAEESPAEEEPAASSAGQGAAAPEPAEGGQGQALEPVASESAPEKAEMKGHEISVLKPLFVRALTKIEPGRNDSNPVWSPSGMFIAFERSIGDKKEIHVGLVDGTVFQTIYHTLSGKSGEKLYFFPGILEDVSYNAGLSWAPREDRFVFMSNGGEGNYDVYLAELGGTVVTRLTNHKEKDGQAHWSPRGNRIVFTSGRTGRGDIYLMNDAGGALTRLTSGGREYLYPQWSPDGKRIALIGGSNENHDIVVIQDITRPRKTMKRLTVWPYDDIRPVWSPDGKKIAFYSNYNMDGDPKVWCIIVLASDGSDPREGSQLAARVVATEVVPDVERGPAWMPDSVRIVFVKDARQEYNPLYVVDSETGAAALIHSDTRMNHDVSCAPDGTIAFRAQVDQWDHIYLMKLPPKGPSSAPGSKNNGSAASQ